VLRVRHQPEHVALAVRDACHAVARAVHVLGVSQDDLAVGEHVAVQLVVDDPIALTVLDWDDELVARVARLGERGRGRLDDDGHVRAQEFELPVPAEHAG
jgi:hypothetical protein